MKKSTPLRSRSKDGSKKEDKRITRMHQMEQMEAAARGTMPTLTLDTTGFVTTVPEHEEQQQIPVVSSVTFERTGLVAGDFLSEGTTTSTTTSRPLRPTTSAPQGNLFTKRDIYEVDQSINLMDASSKRYFDDTADPKRKSSISFVDIFLGGNGSTTGSGSGSSRQSGIKTSWKTSMAGRLGVACLFLAFGVLLALSVPFLLTDDSDFDNHNDQHVRTPAPEHDSIQVLRDSDAAASGPAEFATVDFGTEVKDSQRFDELQDALLELKAASSDRFKDDSTSAFHALRWLTDEDPAQLKADDPDLATRFALASLFYATHQPESAKASVQRQFLENDKDGQSSSSSTTWKRENAWMSEAHVCQWFGVECELNEDTQEKTLVHLNLTSNLLQGTIPPELQVLDHVILLDLSNNLLTGTIPSQLGTSLTLIKYLLLQNNQLTGSIPNELQHMTAAFELYLSENQLTGTIPMGLGTIETLRALYLSQNQLTGTIDQLKGFNKINHLHLNDNKLEGPLPSTIGLLTMLDDLRLSNNKLTGTLPTELASATKLRLLYVANNQLDGQIPDMFEDLHKLTDLELHGNHFKSKLPPTMGALTSLRRLTLEGNTMTGHLPSEWGTMTDLEALDLYHNELIGAIPSEYGGMTSLRELFLSHNFLQAEIPTEFGLLTHLKELDLQHNAIRGKVPTELGNLKSLETLNLGETIVTGTMPEEICERGLRVLEADCKDEIECSCCTKCY